MSLKGSSRQIAVRGKILKLAVHQEYSVCELETQYYPRMRLERMVENGAPDTPENAALRTFARKSPSSMQDMKVVRVTLLNFKKFVTSERAPQSVPRVVGPTARPISLRECLSIGEEFPYLNRQLEREIVSLVSLEPCCREEVWNQEMGSMLTWQGPKRQVDFVLLTAGWTRPHWLGFVKK